jgi:hypothetical protein
MRMVHSEESLVWKYTLKLNDRFWPVALVLQVISGIGRFLNTVGAQIKKEREERAKTRRKNTIRVSQIVSFQDVSAILVLLQVQPYRLGACSDRATFALPKQKTARRELKLTKISCKYYLIFQPPLGTKKRM